jgi:hypothetical protein
VIEKPALSGAFGSYQGAEQRTPQDQQKERWVRRLEKFNTLHLVDNVPATTTMPETTPSTPQMT